LNRAGKCAKERSFALRRRRKAKIALLFNPAGQDIFFLGDLRVLAVN